MTPQQTTFLVVDDFEMMRAVTVNQLRAMGAASILTAKNGAEALRHLQGSKVDVVLSDWNMPVMSGLDLLKAVRADQRLAKTPFLMITAEAERQRIQEVIAAGVSSLLVKPYTAAALVDRVRKLTADGPRSPAAPKAGAAEPLPLACDARTGAGKPDKAEGDKPDTATILVVDDTLLNQKILAGMFEDEYRVLVASNGKQALEFCDSDQPPDLVLMDVMMPDMDGFEVVAQMREHATANVIPVIFVTSLADDEARLRGMELGAVDFVAKSTNPKVLKPRVRNFLRFVEMRKQLQTDYDTMLETARLRDDVENITRHDLKGSLAGIVGMVQGMADDPSMADHHIEQLRMVEKTALQVLNMVNLSSELYKMETGRFKLVPQPVDVGDILRRIADMSRKAFSDKRLVISVDADTPVGHEVLLATGDAMLCYSLFQNLVKNACEAAPEGSRVNVLVKDEDPLRITIENSGTVPVEVRERFFDKFVTHGKEGGTGLGTYSARLLTEAQKGRIALDTNDAEQLVTITVSLPRSHGTPR